MTLPKPPFESIATLSGRELDAKWERGYRCHGLWMGRHRIGRVSLGPPSLTNAARDGYLCEYHGVSKLVEHHAKTLREGKQWVEQCYLVESSRWLDAAKQRAKAWR